MKGASLGYLTREGFRNIWVNRLLTLATVFVLVSCLVIVGSGTLIYLNITAALDLIGAQNVIMVFIEDGSSQEQMDSLKAQLDALDNVGTIEFVAKEDALERQKAEYGEKAALLEGLPNDILPDAYKVTVKDLEQFDATAENIKKLEYVLQIRENSELAGKIASIRNAVSYVCIGVVAVLFFVSLFIVSNTIRITIYNRRLEISIMKAVGATNMFIRWPFIVEGTLLGVFSAVIALGVEYGLYSVACIWLSDVMAMIGGSVVSFAEYILLIFGIFMFIGVFIGSFGSLISLNKYLKEHSNVVEND
ncbi:MAG: permease-like cell division protein FtsX [Clostridia bacterium]|nr:permease-like cell division protein FtsX [Clostridia bacterium]